LPPVEASGTSGMKAALNGVPHGWVKLMKESIKSNAPRFSARRMVKGYIEKFYVPSLQRTEE
jgi:starch phosphorylase